MLMNRSEQICNDFYCNIYIAYFLATCKEPLGMASGKIQDSQITVFSAYNSDFNTYGGHRARLNLTSWPPGHRSSKIELKEKMIITGIATQGYGDPKHPEWVKQYMVLYSTDQPDQLLYFKDQSGGLMVRPFLIF